MMWPPVPNNNILRCTILLTTILAIPSASGQHDPHFLQNRSVIVQLFEWTFADIALECEQFLGPHGYAAVQTSSVVEHSVLPGRPWYERYQPVSYHIRTRSGDAAALRDMIDRCRRVGVRVFVDVVLNHMAGRSPDGDPLLGTDGSIATFENRSYPQVPYVQSEFHRPCAIFDYSDAHMVRNCDLYALPDLDQSLETVRTKMVRHLDDLIGMGVAGFRVGGCKYMWPNDLKVIYGRMRDLSEEHGFAPGARPFVLQEVNDNGLEPISKTEYTFVGTVCEVGYASRLGLAFSGQSPLSSMQHFGPANGFLFSSDAVVYVDNHDIQRQPPADDGNIRTLSFRQPFRFQMATAFMLAHDYGHVRLMSSYEFGENGAGPPTVPGSEEILSPFDADNTTARGWINEHRWTTVVEMVGWRNAVAGEAMRGWRSFGFQQVCFCRGQKGFVAFNGYDDRDFAETLNVCVPEGVYCDVISRGPDGVCAKSVRVDAHRMASVFIAGGVDRVGVVAIHVGAMM